MKATNLSANGWTRFGRCLVLLLSLAICCHLAPAAEGQGMRLEVTMIAPRPAILLHEPLVLDIQVRNAGPSPATMDRLNCNLKGLALRVTGPEGKTRGCRPGVSVNLLRSRQVVLAPDQVYLYRMVLLHGMLGSDGKRKTPGYVFPVPGQYSVVLTYHPGYPKGSTFEAAALQVFVEEPQGRDREALELFCNESIQHFFTMNPSDGQMDAPKDFQRLAEEYADTAYGRFAQFYLLGDLSRVLAMKDDERQKSLAALEGLARNAEFPLPDEVLLHLGLCYACLERKAEAVKVLKDLLAKYPKSPVAVKAKKRLEKLGTKARAPTTSPPSP